MNHIYENAGTGEVDEDSIPPQPLDSHDFLSVSSSSSPIKGKSRDHDPPGVSQFARFPSNVISLILWTVDANGFASLCLLNRRWYQESQKVELYAHHLSRCPSYALSNSVVTGPFRRNDLLRLKTKFAIEVRRNLFAAYLRPRKTLINLISFDTSSSAAFPAGEAFRFAFSPNGKTVLALSSSRIYVLDATTDSITVKRELKTLRRAISASITDDGTLLAVLSSKYQANVYGLPPNAPVRHLQVIVLEHCPKAIAVAHEGTVLAASYDTGVEVFSLAANALSTDRRAVRSEAVDTLTFSGDGSMIVGSSLSLDEPNAVVISAPFYTENDPDLSPRETHSRMWTTQILFPQISSVCSHVALIPGHLEGDATWLFAYDHSLLSFRAVRTDDTRAGVAYFHNPAATRRFSLPAPTIAPSASQDGTLAVAGFAGAGLYIYGVPEKLDVTPDMGAVIDRHERWLQERDFPLTTATGNVIDPLMAYSPSLTGHSESIEDEGLAAKVDWRQSIFVKGHPLESLQGYNAAQWVERPDSGECGFEGKRLLVVAPGGIGRMPDGLGDDMPVDGSRMCLLDFGYGGPAAPDREITIEVGDSESELLTEHIGSIASEVAMERRRTIRAIPGGQASRALLGRSITSIPPPPMPLLDIRDMGDSVSQPTSPVAAAGEQGPVGTHVLQPAQTGAVFQNAPYPPRPPIGSPEFADQPPRRANGRPMSEDSWETPPPPYRTDLRGVHGGPQSSSRGLPSVSADGAGPLRRSSSERRPSRHDIDYASSNLYRESPLDSAGLHNQARLSSTMDGMPTTESAPTRKRMSQYGGLAARGGRRQQSMVSLDTVSESATRQQGRLSVQISSPSSANRSDQNTPAHLKSRPVTFDGASPEAGHSSQRRSALPVSPLTPETRLSPIGNYHDSIDENLVAEPLGHNQPNQLIHTSFSPPTSNLPRNIAAPTNRNHVDGHQNQSFQPRPTPAPLVTDSPPYPPLLPGDHEHYQFDQGASAQSERLLHLTPPNLGAASPPQPTHPPQGGSSIAGFLRSVTSQQPRRGLGVVTRKPLNQIANNYGHSGTSASVPDLVTRPVRGGHPDILSTIPDVVSRPQTRDRRSRVISRAQSMISRPTTMIMETSAYNETRMTMPPPEIPRPGRARRKRFATADPRTDEIGGGTGGGGSGSYNNGSGARKGNKSSRCVIM